MKPISLTTIKSFVWRAAFILLMLVMVSSHFTFRYAAKFTSTATGSDTAKVASFHGGEVELGRMEPHDVDVELLSAQVDRQNTIKTYYAFYATYYLTFEPSEVARQFSFEMYYDQAIGSGSVKADRVSFACPNIGANHLRRLSSDYAKHKYDSFTSDDPMVEGSSINTLFPRITNGSLVDVMNGADAGSANGLDFATTVKDRVYYGYKGVNGAFDTKEARNTALGAVKTTWKYGAADANATDFVTTETTTATVVTGQDNLERPIYTENVDVNRTRISLFSDVVVPMEGAVYEVSFIFFIDGSYDSSVKDGKITYMNYVKYNLNCWQVD